MSIYFNQTNITSGTPQFITRAEVSAAFSTIASDLSGFDWNQLLYNPDPKFSTIIMNPTGNITGGQYYTATGALGVSSVLATYNRPYPTGTNPNFFLGLRDNIGGVNYTPLVTGGSIVKNQIFTNAVASYMTPDKTGFFDANFNDVNVSQFNSAVNGVALKNISSINGNPPTGATTFTTLTGNTLIAQQVNAAQYVGLSSINGIAYQSPYSIGYTQAATAVSIPSGSAALAYSIALPASYLKQNTTYLYDVPIQVTSWPPGSPTGMNMFIGIRLGGNGQINYQIPLYIVNTSQGIVLSLTGIAQTNSASAPSTNTIDIVLIQSSGSTFTPTLQSPPSAGGLNVYTIKPLS